VVKVLNKFKQKVEINVNSVSGVVQIYYKISPGQNTPVVELQQLCIEKGLPKPTQIVLKQLFTQQPWAEAGVGLTIGKKGQPTLIRNLQRI